MMTCHYSWMSSLFVVVVLGVEDDGPTHYLLDVQAVVCCCGRRMMDFPHIHCIFPAASYLPPTEVFQSSVLGQLFFGAFCVVPILFCRINADDGLIRHFVNPGADILTNHSSLVELQTTSLADAIGMDAFINIHDIPTCNPARETEGEEEREEDNLHFEMRCPVCLVQ
ncbi:hypothetical protein LSTR_LSTR015943 [Laodelphax striatellus]|uniref:Uncharacterized protein n=1 Tax=Laodelphax striatellus TaxID=195883 RepID=A0A482WTB1_LAOST|nr:hypothetical protein LSTR_LSTR015943 [Laodelphax striatellus]